MVVDHIKKTGFLILVKLRRGNAFIRLDIIHISNNTDSAGRIDLIEQIRKGGISFSVRIVSQKEELSGHGSAVINTEYIVRGNRNHFLDDLLFRFLRRHFDLIDKLKQCRCRAHNDRSYKRDRNSFRERLLIHVRSRHRADKHAKRNDCHHKPVQDHIGDTLVQCSDQKHRKCRSHRASDGAGY